jgi:23S rRNA G2069 N7-methylase RlmK/C1962 C5-methylase RlmI
MNMTKKKTGRPAASRTAHLGDMLSDKFSDVWKLLSETTIFLSRTKDSDAYEKQLRSWRLELQSSNRNPDIARRIRSDLTALRKNLRLQGYDLSLGRQNLIIDGFRNDASLGEGFRRVVIFISDSKIFFLTGEDNHITLAEFLERRLEAEIQTRKKWIRILDRHYLWYRRQGQNLILSGSDTETKEDFERFSAMCAANSLLFLGGLKGLR